MEIEELLNEEKIKFSDGEQVVESKVFAFSDIQSIYIGEQNPARNRAYAIIAVGIVLVILTTRWFLAGGVFAILVGIVSFFDSRRHYSVILKTKTGDATIAKREDLRRIKKTHGYLNEKITFPKDI